MEEKKKRILDLVEQGILTSEEALVLLERLNEQSPTEEATKERATFTKEKKSDEPFTEEKKREQPFTSGSNKTFFDEVAKDLAQVGSQFMGFMKTAVDQVKDFDVKNAAVVHETLQEERTFAAEDVERLSFDLAHGDVAITSSERSDIHVTFDVDVYAPMPKAEAEEHFARYVQAVVQKETLYISSQWKLANVKVTLQLPKKTYDRLHIGTNKGDVVIGDVTTRILNIDTIAGSVTVDAVDFTDSTIETKHGKVKVTNSIGRTLDVDTVNGEVSVHSSLEEVELESTNGNIIFTATNRLRKLDVDSSLGTIEVYVPKTLTFKGEAETKIGQLDVRLDAARYEKEEREFFQKEIKFAQDGVTDEANIDLDTNVGTVLVRHTTVE